jgi:hypothetical protein
MITAKPCEGQAIKNTCEGQAIKIGLSPYRGTVYKKYEKVPVADSIYLLP